MHQNPIRPDKQLTLRAIVIGCFVGGIIACTNVYIGLKIGFTFGASIVSAMLGFAILSNFSKPTSVLETNILQTAGSAAGATASAAGLVMAIPALEMLGYHFAWWELMAWTLSIGFLGIFFAVPLRQQMVVVENLRFPTGTAAAETILAMFAEAKEAREKARVLVVAAITAGLFSFLAFSYPSLESPPIDQWIGGAFLATAAAWGFKLYFGPALFGVGFLIGPRVVLSLAFGAVLAWAVIGPLVQAYGWAPGPIMSFSEGARGWLLWPGVALMVSEALASLVMNWRSILRSFKPIQNTSAVAEETIPTRWWVKGLALGSAMTVGVGYFVFDIPMWLTVIAIGLSFILAIVAVRSTGETDINPISGVGKVTQLVFGGLAPGQLGVNLMAAGITGAGASQAGDMMQDFKTGRLLGASPQKQFLAQLVGVFAGILFVVPVYFLFTSAYTLGDPSMPAPAAFAWKAMAEVLAGETGGLPPNAIGAVIIAAAIGCLLPVLRTSEKLAAYIPSGLAIGIAFIIPAYFSLVIFYGLIVWWLWRLINPGSVHQYNFAVASGLVAGEGLMGVVNAARSVIGG